MNLDDHTTALRLSIPIEGLNCASCVGRTERALAAVPGINEVSVNLVTGRASIKFGTPTAIGDAIGAIVQAGYAAPEAVTTIGIEGMTCASCAGRVERALGGIPGVTAAGVNLATARVDVRHPAGTVERGAIDAAIRAAGYVPGDITRDGSADRDDRQMRESARLTRDTVVSAILAVPIVILDMGSHVLPGFRQAAAGILGATGSAYLQAALATLVLAWPGARFFRIGIPGLLRLHPDMNALVALGAGAAYLYSLVSTLAPTLLPEGSAQLYFEASVLVVTLILLGRSLEAGARRRSGDAIRQLLQLAPKTARVLRDGREIDVPPGDLALGEIVRVRPGERIAADGIVVAGSSYIDESMVTGEATPVVKREGAATIGGTVNTTGSLDLRVSRVGADTVLAQIVRMVEEAQGGKLPVQALVDRVVTWFVPVVMVLSAATFLSWLTFGPSPALGPAIVAAISVLIIACPCAMGLATPTSILVGTGRAARRGVLFRHGAALQALQTVGVVAFDKTGTLTEGRPRLTDLVAAPGFDPEGSLGLAAAVEAHSEHPLAGAVVASARERGGTIGPAELVESLPGFGISGRAAGRTVIVGGRRMMERDRIAVDALATEADRLEGQARNPIFVAIDGRVGAVLAVSDPIRRDAGAAVAALRAQGLRVAMITGDGRVMAEAVGNELGIDEITADVLPDGKVAALQSLRSAYGPVAFVGDGINDAPSLAEADVGIAIGTGTDIAAESADVVLMSGALTGVIDAIAISRATMRNIRQNLFWAFAYNAALIPVAAGALLPLGGPLLSPVLAAGAMAMSSVFVVGNALRLRGAGAAPVAPREDGWKRTAPRAA